MGLTTAAELPLMLASGSEAAQNRLWTTEMQMCGMCKFFEGGAMMGGRLGGKLGTVARHPCPGGNTVGRLSQSREEVSSRVDLCDCKDLRL